MKLNQLVFTSASTTKGKGYQTIGASGGTSPAERAAIEWHVHLKQAMPESVDFKGSLSYFLLDKDAPRVCIARTFPAGSDHVGRPGRVLTHALILERADFEALHNDPFLFDRLASDGGLYRNSDEVPSEMPVRDVDFGEPTVPRLDRLPGGSRGAETLGAVLSAVYSEQGSAIIAEDFPLEALELAFRCVPLPLRLELTFATLQLSPKDEAFRVIGMPPSVADEDSLRQSRRALLALEGGRLPDGARTAPYVSLVLDLLEKADGKGLAALLDRAGDLGLARGMADLGKLADVMQAERDFLSKPSVAGLLRLSGLLEGAAADRRREMVLSRFETTLDAMLRESDWGDLPELLRRVASIEGAPAGSRGETRMSRAVVEGAGTLLRLATLQRFCGFMTMLRRTDEEAGTRLVSASVGRHGGALLDGVSAKREPDASDVRCLEMVLAEEARDPSASGPLIDRLARLATSAFARDGRVRDVLVRSAQACEKRVAPGSAGAGEGRESLEGLLEVYGELGDEDGQLRMHAALLAERHAHGALLVSESRCEGFIKWASQGNRAAWRVQRLAALLEEKDRGLALDALAKCLTLKEVRPSGAVWAVLLLQFERLSAVRGPGRARAQGYWSQMMNRFSEVPQDLRVRLVADYISSLGAWDRLKLRWRSTLAAFSLGLAVGLACAVLVQNGWRGRERTSPAGPRGAPAGRAPRARPDPVGEAPAWGAAEDSSPAGDPPAPEHGKTVGDGVGSEEAEEFESRGR